MGQGKSLGPYIQTVGELRVKLRDIRKQFRKQNRHSPVEFITGYVKLAESIKEETELRGAEPENIVRDLQDITGVRVMAQFINDVNEVLTLLRGRHDMTTVQERDCTSNIKASDCRSYHVIVEYPVDTIDGQKTVLAEIQIRTLAMNFWMTTEHSLNYKYRGEFSDEIKKHLETTVKIALKLDEGMRKIREDVREVQLLFDPTSRKLSNGVGSNDDIDEYYR